MAKYYISPGVIVPREVLNNVLLNRDEFDPIFSALLQESFTEIASGLQGDFLETEVTENTEIESTKFNLLFSSTDGTFNVQRESIAGVKQVVAMNEPAPGVVVNSFGIIHTGNTDMKLCIATDDRVYLQAGDDITTEYSQVIAEPTYAEVSYTATGGDNSTLTVANGTITLTAVKTVVSNLGAASVISPVSGSNLKVKTEGQGSANSDSIEISTGEVATLGSTGDIEIITGNTLNGDTGSIVLRTGTATTGDGGKIRLELGDGSVADGRLIISNLPEFADNAAALLGGLVAGNVYKTNTGELRITV